MRHAFLSGTDWSAYAARRCASASNVETPRRDVAADRNLPTGDHDEPPVWRRAGTRAGPANSPHL